MSASFENVERAFRIQCDSPRIDKWRLRCLHAIRWNATLAIASDRGDDSRFKIYDADPPIIEVRDKKILLRRIESDAIYISEFGIARCAPISAEAFPPGPRECKNF